MIDHEAVNALADALAAGSERKRTDAPATVTRIDQDGTVWVHVPGGVAETPARSTTAGVSVGDVVRVNVENGALTVTGNTTAPSASVQSVERVDTAQRKTAATAEAAAEDASSALDAAEAAQAAAQRTESYFWHDSQGAHVSEQPNSTDGNNVLIDSDSVDIRNGEDVLASFGVRTVESPSGDVTERYADFNGLLIASEDGASKTISAEFGMVIESDSVDIYGLNALAPTFSGQATFKGVPVFEQGLPQQVKAVDFSHTATSGTASSFTNAVAFDGGEGWVAVGVLDTYTSRYGVCPIAGARITAGSGAQSGTVTVYHYHVNSTSYTDVADTVRVLFRRA